MSNVIEVDVAIIGAGPAGSALATYMARDGKKVAIFEREVFPRFRIGESLLPLNLALFRELGVEEELERRFIRKYAANFSNSDGTRQQRFPFAQAFNKSYPYCYQVERAALDQVLLDNAVKAGAKVFMGYNVRELIKEDSVVVGLVAEAMDGAASVANKSVTIKSKVVADCSGRSAFCGSRDKLKRDVQLETRTAFFSHYENVERDPGEREGDIQIVAFEHGWFWMIPFKGNTTSVGMVVTDSYLATRQKLALAHPEQRGTHDESNAAVAGAADAANDAFLAKTINETPYVRDRMRDARQKFSARAIGNFSYVMDRYAGDGYVMVGDAGAFLDPVFSSGVFLTMKAAQLVAADLRLAFHTGDFSENSFARYERKIRGAQAVFLKFIRGWYDPAFVDLFFTPRNTLGLRTAITSVLAADLFDARHLWKLKLRIQLLFLLAEAHRFSLRRSNGGRSLVQRMAV